MVALAFSSSVSSSNNHHFDYSATVMSHLSVFMTPTVGPTLGLKQIFIRDEIKIE